MLLTRKSSTAAAGADSSLLSSLARGFRGRSPPWTGAPSCAVPATARWAARIDAVVENGVWVRQEPVFDSPINLGAHCAKGARCASTATASTACATR